jgi:hypothetical protein
LSAAHTHLVDSFESTPRLALLSPEKGSGKTRSLEVLELLCAKPQQPVNMSAAALFRIVSAEKPTILFDEVDAFFNPKAKEHEDVRSLLNSGHRKGATALRCVGEPAKMEVRAFSSYCPVALAGIGDLPDTILDRAVLLQMRRRRPDEQITPFRFRQAGPRGKVLHDQLAAWAKRVAQAAAEAEPELPAGLTDRPADVWEPLIVVADLAGGDWPARARAAAAKLNAERVERDPSLGVRLLADIRAEFAVEKLATESLLEKLCALDESPWGDLRGKALDARGLSARLRKYGIRSVAVSPDGSEPQPQPPVPPSHPPTGAATPPHDQTTPLARPAPSRPAPGEAPSQPRTHRPCARHQSSTPTALAIRTAA